MCCIDSLSARAYTAEYFVCVCVRVCVSVCSLMNMCVFCVRVCVCALLRNSPMGATNTWGYVCACFRVYSQLKQYWF